MSNLMYNSKNDVLVSRADLAGMETPPAMGRFHQPYPFDEYVNEIEHHLNRNGIAIAKEEYAVTKDSNRLFGMMEIEPIEGELITADDWKLTIGVRGAHDQRIPRGISLGSAVMVCSNLCFHGNLGTFKTKQTLNMRSRLPQMINAAVSRIPEMAAVQERKFDAYKDMQLKPRWGDAALVEIFRQGGFSSGQLATAIREWDKPSYDEHNEFGHSVWQLFNAATEALKPTGERVNMNTVQQRSEIVSGFMDTIVKL